MAETGRRGRNPPLPPNFVTFRQLRDRRVAEAEAQAQPQSQDLHMDRSSTEETPDLQPLLPPNYVSLRQLREMRLKEKAEQEREKGKEKEKQCDDLAEVPPDYVSLNQLQKRRVKDEKERERDKNKGKAQKEEKEVHSPILSQNYVSLRQLKELRIEEKEQKEAKDETQKARLQQSKVQERGDESGQIEVKISKKAGNQVRNWQAMKPDKLGLMRSSWVWEPVLPPASTSTITGTKSSDVIFPLENAGMSHEVVMTVSHQTEDAGTNGKKSSKKKKKKKRGNIKRTTGKGKNEPVRGPEGPIDASGLNIDEALNESNSTSKMLALSQNENDTVKKGKDNNYNLIEPKTTSSTVLVEEKKFNGPQSFRSKRHKSKGQSKGKNSSLSEPGHNVDPLIEVTKGSDGVEVIGFKIENEIEQMNKGKKVNILELSDQTQSHEEQKGVHVADEVIASELQIGEEKESDKNFNLPESSKWRSQAGVRRRGRNPSGWSRVKGHQRAESVLVGPAEHLKGVADWVWVPKKVLNSA